MDVFVLWHIRHARNLDGSPTVHRDDGELMWDEENGDDLKVLGVYSSEHRASDLAQAARLLPGFRDEPDCFMIDTYEVDEDRWTDGFVSIPRAEE